LVSFPLFSLPGPAPGGPFFSLCPLRANGMSKVFFLKNKTAPVFFFAIANPNRNGQPAPPLSSGVFGRGVWWSQKFTSRPPPPPPPPKLFFFPFFFWPSGGEKNMSRNQNSWFDGGQNGCFPFLGFVVNQKGFWKKVALGPNVLPRWWGKTTQNLDGGAWAPVGGKHKRLFFFSGGALFAANGGPGLQPNPAPPNGKQTVGKPPNKRGEGLCGCWGPPPFRGSPSGPLGGVCWPKASFWAPQQSGQAQKLFSTE